MSHRPPAVRDYSLDNIRFLLIFSVVFAHLLEVCNPFTGMWMIYKWIYSFHMPVFIFLFGYNVKYSLKKILHRWCIPYVVFQSAYLLFSRIVLKDSLVFQFATPYWLLWYMLVCIYYQLLLPLFETDSKRRQATAVLCAFVISLLVGYEKSVGNYMSISRFFVFGPWFLLGYYSKKNHLMDRLAIGPKGRFGVAVGALLAMACMVPCLSRIPKPLLYGSYAYAKCAGALWMRAMAWGISFLMILFLFAGVKPYLSKKLILITTIGQNTWPIFLLHGFVVKAVPVYAPELVRSPWHVILLSCGILVLAGNRLCSKAIGWTGFLWIGKLWEAIRTGSKGV